MKLRYSSPFFLKGPLPNPHDNFTGWLSSFANGRAELSFLDHCAWSFWIQLRRTYPRRRLMICRDLKWYAIRHRCDWEAQTGQKGIGDLNRWMVLYTAFQSVHAEKFAHPINWAQGRVCVARQRRKKELELDVGHCQRWERNRGRIETVIDFNWTIVKKQFFDPSFFSPWRCMQQFNNRPWTPGFWFEYHICAFAMYSIDRLALSISTIYFSILALAWTSIIMVKITLRW